MRYRLRDAWIEAGRVELCGQEFYVVIRDGELVGMPRGTFETLFVRCEPESEIAPNAPKPMPVATQHQQEDIPDGKMKTNAKIEQPQRQPKAQFLRPADDDYEDGEFADYPPALRDARARAQRAVYDALLCENLDVRGIVDHLAKKNVRMTDNQEQWVSSGLFILRRKGLVYRTGGVGSKWAVVPQREREGQDARPLP